MHRVSYPGILICLLAACAPAFPQAHSHHDRCLLAALNRTPAVSRLGANPAEPPSGEEGEEASNPGEETDVEVPEPAKEERGTRRKSFLRSRTGTILLVVAGTLVAGTLARQSIEE